MLSFVCATLSFALFSARVSVLVQQIERQTVGPNAPVSKSIIDIFAVIDISSVRTTAAAVYDWSLIVAVIAALVGGWITVAITVRFFVRLLGNRLFGGI